MEDKMEVIREIENGNHITSADDVAQYLDEFKKEDREFFIVIGLSTQNKVIYREINAIGIQDQTMVHPREIFRSAIMKSAHNIIIAHNHPSGSLEASPDDKEVYKKLKEAGELLGIPVLDCIIVSSEGHISLKDEDWDFE